VQLALQQGKLAEARRLSKSVEFNLHPPIWYFYVPQITPIKLLVAEGTPGGLEKARLQLDGLDEHTHELNLNNVRTDVLALQALVYDALDENTAAFEKLRAALALGEPGEFIRTFVDLGSPMANLLLRLIEQEAGIKHTDYVHRILAAFPDEVRAGRSTASVPDRSGYEPTHMSSIDPLTRRELQILKLLTTDLSRQEIAARLVISPGTVHTHTKNIYSKLHVNNRIQAVNRARELGLI
jgi:LuxR family maltose regulon positive regulatory protein